MPSPADDLPDDGDDLVRIARRVLKSVGARSLKIATAESCTGGLLASLITDIEGLSNLFEAGYVTYSEAAKVELLGIDPVDIRRYGVVSAEIAQAMARGAQTRSRADLVVAITGFAGPAGPREEAGLVYLALAARGRAMTVRECHFGPASRQDVRKLTAHRAFEMIAEAVASMDWPDSDTPPARRQG